MIRFETKHYRECALCRERTTERSVGDTLHRAIIISFVVGIVDMIVVVFVNKYISDLWLRWLIDMILGGFCGWQLGLMWKRMYKRIYARIEAVYYDIQILSDRIDELQDEKEDNEDYELVGDRDD